MREHFFCDVPIYRLPERDYYADREKYVNKMLWGPSAGGSREVLEGFYKRNPGNKIQRQESYEKEYGGPWRFNEIIGYIRLQFPGRHIHGELWIGDANRIVRKRKKTIFYKSKEFVPEMKLPRNATKSQIYKVIIKYIESAKQFLKGRFVDDSHFRTIGPYVD